MIFKVSVMLRRTVSWPVSLGVKPHLELKTRSLLLSDNYDFVDVGALSDERTGLSFTAIKISSADLLHNLSTDPTENTTSNSSSVVACLTFAAVAVFVAAETYLPAVA
jgi:hypothetical protein